MVTFGFTFIETKTNQIKQFKIKQLLSSCKRDFF